MWRDIEGKIILFNFRPRVFLSLALRADFRPRAIIVVAPPPLSSITNCGRDGGLVASFLMTLLRPFLVKIGAVISL